MNWLEVIELATEVGEAALGDSVAIEADQAVTSPPVIVELDGHKYSATLNLSPVPASA